MMFRLLILTILLATLLSGCARNRDLTPKRSDAYASSATGKRVVITDQNDQPILKIRARRNAWKVYDESFHATGFVRWPAASTSLDPPQNQPAPHIETIARQHTATFQNVGTNNEVFELPGHLRIEMIEAGWAVFDPSAKLLGLFERELPPPNPDQPASDQPDNNTATERWTLRAAYNTPTLWSAHQQGQQIIAQHKDGKTYTTHAAHFSAPALLASELTALPALDRAALAAWFIHMMPDAS